MGDSCCPVEFVCERYLTFSKSLLCIMHSLFIKQNSNVKILSNQKVFDRGKKELENTKEREHESIFTFEMALECFQTDFLPQAEQSVILLARERCRTVNINARHRKYSIKAEKPSEPAITFQIYFW